MGNNKWIDSAYAVNYVVIYEVDSMRNEERYDNPSDAVKREEQLRAAGTFAYTEIERY
jgi:hypothetical protein